MKSGDPTGAEPPRRTDAEQARLERSLTELFEERIAFNGLLGLRIQSLEGRAISIGFAMRPELIGHYLHGRLHGGVISSALDVAGGLAVMRGISEHWPQEKTPEVLQRFAGLATIDMRVDYLREGVGERFVAEAEVVRLGRRIAATSMRLLSDRDILLATGNANYIVS